MTDAPPPQHEDRKVRVGYIYPTDSWSLLRLTSPVCEPLSHPYLYTNNRNLKPLCWSFKTLEGHPSPAGLVTSPFSCHLAWFPQMLHLARVYHISSAATERGYPIVIKPSHCRRWAPVRVCITMNISPCLQDLLQQALCLEIPSPQLSRLPEFHLHLFLWASSRHSPGISHKTQIVQCWRFHTGINGLIFILEIGIIHYKDEWSNSHCFLKYFNFIFT